jgi:predicted ester cyclase
MNIKGTLMRRLGLIVSIAAIIGALALAGSAATARTASSRGGHTTTAASNERIVLAFLRDVLAEHHGSHAANYITPGMQFHAGTVGTIVGRANVTGLLSSLVTSIPNLYPALQDILAHGNEVMVRLVVTGTLEHPLLGIPGTGQPLRWDAIDLYRLKGGKIAEEWASEDLTAILNDTGTYKAPWIH